MGRRLYTQKGSCRDKHYHSLLPEELMCEVCSEQAKYSDRYLLQMEKNSGITILGNCHAILDTLSPSIISKRKAYMEAGKGRRRKRCVSVYSPDHRMKSGKSKHNLLILLVSLKFLCTLTKGVESLLLQTLELKKPLRWLLMLYLTLFHPQKKD